MIRKFLISILLFTISTMGSPAYGEALSTEGKIQNIILFIGDGMHKQHEIAASRYLTGTDNALIWNQFPYKTFVSTWDIDTYNRYAYNLNKPAFSYEKFDPLIGYNPESGGNNPYPMATNINDSYFLTPLLQNKGEIIPNIPATDSAASATAIATGRKTEAGNISWQPGDPENGSIKTIAEIIKEKRKASIGVVTTVPFNHATPAAFISHNILRENYYTGGYKGLGIADEIMKITRPDVVIGGGHPDFDKQGYLSKKLYKELLWSDDYIVAERRKGEDGGISLLNASNIAFEHDKMLFGIFGGRDGNFESPIPIHSPDNPKIKRAVENPALADATISALNVLGKNENGFFLMVEQGDIDWANHQNNYKAMIGCVLDLNEAVKSAIEFINKPDDDIDWDNTLLIVTADHANSYMRLNDEKKLCKGCLPEQRRMFGFVGKWVYPDRKVKYSLGGHTNELVSLYAMGAGIGLFKEYEGKWYQGTKIIDNTHIFHVMNSALDLKNIKSGLSSRKN
ncbi:MAG: hypothetical protein ACD_20C00109G0029 [uncultured bacterium]|nr:MAG: hypothetical protein ACD_20C00109G0029 [uncultured bacterium]HBH17962.1 hypothetical protein [Cyanobacteria bacterium UBA9579]